MSSFERNVEDLSPERWARVVLSAARLTKKLAERTGEAVPADVNEILSTSEVDLVRRRTNAIAEEVRKTDASAAADQSVKGSDEGSAGSSAQTAAPPGQVSEEWHTNSPVVVPLEFVRIPTSAGVTADFFTDLTLLRLARQLNVEAEGQPNPDKRDAQQELSRALLSYWATFADHDWRMPPDLGGSMPEGATDD
ncbi:hypothetical protein FHT40_002440 [Mycolicibacterium sp. BK556]|uniref:hypothetical protein n=1 Tax=unclassified Mycolicibacterium TaxID=2636767 RepID=UPI001607F8D0|nr:MULTISPECIES: hypothetical protein [unclassified Mycolicibacterium]MBB3602779.1 hypothetical protein [Mycolicibacterium sp. BK556]MBB3632974.1 hypothetical protein [Mycolicibacterium sp. BK607]